MGLRGLLFGLLLVVVALGIAEAIVCTPDFCSRVRCKVESEESCAAQNGIVKPGGFCNCCPTCIIQLREGEACGTPFDGLLGVPPPTRECGFGTHCDRVQKVCKYYRV